MMRDLRLALRSLRHAPKLAAACVVTFALGIGANTAVFSMANAFLFRPLPVQQPGQLWIVRAVPPPGADSTTLKLAPGDMRLLRKQGAAVFAGAAEASLQQVGLSVDDQARSAWALYVTPSFFPLLGVAPARGRFFTRPRQPGVVISYEYWQSRVRGRENVMGQAAVLEGKPMTILGVGPKGFHGISSLFDTQVFVPMRLGATQVFGALPLVRLRPGVAPAAAQVALTGFARTLARLHPAQDARLRLRMMPLGVGFINSTGHSPFPMVSALFLTLSGLVLLLAAANVMGLLLARGAARERELAVRAALGASRPRLLRQVFLETALLAAAGAAGGLALGVLASRILSGLPPNIGFPIVLNFSLDWRVFGYTLAMAIVIALVAGLAPAWRAASAEPNRALRSEGGGATRRQRLRSLLVGAQIAFSLVLLITAGLFVRSLRHAESADLGFVADGVWNYSFDASGAGYAVAHGAEFYQTLLPRARALPGVEAAALTQMVPFGLDSYGDEVIAGKRTAGAGYSAISGGYFTAMKIPLLRGRGFAAMDDDAAPRVVVVSAALARQLWPRGGAVGQLLVRAEDRTHPLRVVGVAGDALTSFDDPSRLFFYFPLAQSYQPQMTLIARLRPGANAAAVGAALRRMDPNVPMSAQSMAQAISGMNGLYMFRLGANLAGWMGLVGLVLALVGVYGVVAYAAEQRRRELGIRVALGARRRQLLGAVARPAAVIVGAGLAVGLLLAAALGQAVAAFLQGVSGLDPLTFITAALLLAAVAAAAALVPAWRAARADPLAALRCE